MINRFVPFILCFLCLASPSIMQAQGSLNLIPWPVEVKQQPGSYRLKSTMTISMELPQQDQERLYNYLRDELKKMDLSLVKAASGQQADISFKMKRMPTSGKPAYELSVSEVGIVITSNFEEPAFHGIQTLLQLIPVGSENGLYEIPFVEIFDHARFGYRGMHLDVSRHFFPISFVKRYIDYLAYHKLNRFHWHLTEDQGWRIEIKKYPELAKTSAWRNGTIIGRYPGTGNDNKVHGGYYTQDEIREVVKYAAERFIDVIPEIEMPGHSSAAIAAFPWLSCFPQKPTLIPASMISARSQKEQENGRIKLVQETWGVFDDVYCAGNDSTFIFLQHVIDEVSELFPSKYFHIGGDECPKTHWKQCPRCQKRMKDHNLKDEHELQSYFVQRIEKYLQTKDKTLIGWDEILEGGLAPNAVVMSWRGEKGGIEAAKQEHYVIMSPGSPVYFDHSQTENEDSVTFGSYNPIEKVYAWDPVPKELDEKQAKFILGGQANVWTEYMNNTKKIEYMIFPRMAALSELLWTKKENMNWEKFQERIPAQLERYEHWGANYSRAVYDTRSIINPSPDNRGVLWVLESKAPGVKIQWSKTLTEADPPNPPAFYSYTVPIPITKTGSYQAWTVKNGKRTGNTISQNFSFSKSTGKKISLKDEASKSYPGNGAFTLVDGIISEKGFLRTKEFLGFQQDCEAVIDFGENQTISSVIVHALKRRTSWIWEPAAAELFTSTNGSDWVSINKSEVFIDGKNGKGSIQLRFQARPARYIKVVVKNYGKIPEGNAGAGRNSWLFLDEIEVQ